MATPTAPSPSTGPSCVSTVTATGSVLTEPEMMRARLMGRAATGSAPPSFKALQRSEQHLQQWANDYSTGSSMDLFARPIS